MMHLVTGDTSGLGASEFALLDYSLKSVAQQRSLQAEILQHQFIFCGEGTGLVKAAARSVKPCDS
jgi:hypothetical protein